ncbi:hypothetical protein Hanom_Chr11g00997041 [Helianthus anomalus]
MRCVNFQLTLLMSLKRVWVWRERKLKVLRQFRMTQAVYKRRRSKVPHQSMTVKRLMVLMSHKMVLVQFQPHLRQKRPGKDVMMGMT